MFHIIRAQNASGKTQQAKPGMASSELGATIVAQFTRVVFRRQEKSWEKCDFLENFLPGSPVAASTPPKLSARPYNCRPRFIRSANYDFAHFSPTYPTQRARIRTGRRPSQLDIALIVVALMGHSAPIVGRKRPRRRGRYRDCMATAMLERGNVLAFRGVRPGKSQQRDLPTVRAGPGALKKGVPRVFKTHYRGANRFTTRYAPR